MVGAVLVVLTTHMLLSVLPVWPHSRSWGYYPSGGLGLRPLTWASMRACSAATEIISLPN